MGAAYFGQNYNLFSRDVELLEGLPKDDLGQAVRVCISSVEGVDSPIESVRVTNSWVE